ncbi:fimbrillin family protein [Segatella oulorum]|uniref:fimbrillin family protein n=1 Tax=Segatella oulorum TaxID=28136 RepID=UPI0028EB6CF9|nr:fimbrillin family protein [Segatella oulorum]
MTRKYFYSNRLRHALPFAAASFTVGLALFACSDKDIDSNENNGKALVAFNVSETQDQAQAGAKSYGPISRAAFANQLALQDLAPEDLTMQKLPVQGTASQGLCLIETTVAGVPSQREDETPTRANITTMTTMQNFSTTAFYGSSDTSLEPWFYDKDTNKDGTLVTPIYWDWFKNHACFYAVYPKPDNNKIKLSPASHTGTPYVDFEVEPNVTDQKDLMTACSGNVHTDIGAMSATAPRTDLTFRHALTAVRFKVGQNLSWNKTITKVEIVGAKSKGRYTFPTDKNLSGSWDAVSTPTTFTLDGLSVSTSEAVNNIIVGKPGDNFVFYMIPQSLAGVSVKIYFADATPPIAVNLAGTWKPGTTKTYALSQNTSSWQYELTVTPPAAAEYNATSTGNYTIQSYRKDGAIQKPVPWKVVGYSTDGGLTWSNNKPTWFTGLTKENGDGSTNLSGETGIAILQPDALINKLAQMNAALKQNPKGSPTNYYDLSMYDIKGTPRLSRSTANCYIISHPGYYKIPLVYGNAITNGNNNTNAYQTSNTGTYILTHFKDHNNQDITNPWITQSNGGTNAPNGAKLVWADEKGLVTNLAVTGSGTNAFVQFHVPEDKIKNGNAVIAVMRGSTVVWSWHLWFIHDDALNTITCTNFQGYDYKFTEETLGMKYTSWTATSYTSPRSVKVKVVQCYGQGNPMVPKEGIITITQKETNLKQGSVTYYQGGRKDAHPSTEEVKEGAFNIVSLALSIPDGIQHPENFYYGSSSSYIYNLWSANNTTTGYNDNNVVKTVYDPCPAGFKLPPSNAFTGFSFEGRDNSVPNTSEPWNNGCNFNNKITDPDATVYFPVSGQRFMNQLRYIGTRSFYWSAVPYGYSNYCVLYFGSDFMLPRSYWGGNESECAVHPIADN